MALGTGMMYLIHRAMVADEQQVERDEAPEPSRVGDSVSELRQNIAA
jgi:hypothetical protein